MLYEQMNKSQNISFDLIKKIKFEEMVSLSDVDTYYFTGPNELLNHFNINFTLSEEATLALLFSKEEGFITATISPTVNGSDIDVTEINLTSKDLELMMDIKDKEIGLGRCASGKQFNFKIQQLSENNFLVRSDSRKYGKNEIVFQGITYNECLDYIDKNTENNPLSYYVIKDLASWRSDVWQENIPEKSEVERFDTVEEAIIKFNEYLSMDYLNSTIINPDNNSQMRRLALGVSFHPYGVGEYDLLHTEGKKVLLISDAVGEREYGYEKFMTNINFINDLNKIVNEINIDFYSYYQSMTFEEFVNERLMFLNAKYPEENHTRDETIKFAKHFLDKRPNYLKQHQKNYRVEFGQFLPPYLHKAEIGFRKRGR